MPEVTIKRVVVRRGKAGGYRFYAYGGNDRKVAYGQRYRRKADALAAAEAICPPGVWVEDATFPLKK